MTNTTYNVVTDDTEMENTTVGLAPRVQRVGRLTVSDEVGAFIIARCDCGFPSTVVPVSMWGTVLGCASCHSAEQELREREAAEQARERAAEQKHARRESQLKELYYLPHVEDLTPALRKLFARLVAEGSTVSVPQLESLLHITSDEAWESIILPMLNANLLLERVGPYAEARPYNLLEPYSMHAQPSSRFQIRSMAAMQLEKMESAAGRTAPAPTLAVATAPAATPTIPCSVDSATLADLADWIRARCTPAESESASTVLVRAKYVAYAEERGETPLAPEQFTEALAYLGYPVRNGKYAGLRLKWLKELSTAAS